MIGPFDPGLLNLRSLYVYIVRPKFSVTKVSGEGQNKAMSEDLSDLASKLFNKYRENYNVLKQLYVKKNIPFLPYAGCEIKFAGKSMSSRQMNGFLQDRTIHSCGSNTYPINTQSIFDPFNFKKHWTFTGEPNAEQVKVLNTEFETVRFSLSEFRKRAAVKGFWIMYLMETERKVVNFNYDKKYGWENSLVYTTGDILAETSDNFIKVVDKILSSPEFKSFGEFTDPNKIRAIISDRLFEIFVNRYFTCSHFQVQTCLICNDSFYPETETEWVGKVPPVFCGICLEMGFSASTEFFRQLNFKPEVRRNNLIEGLKIYVEYFGFIPAVGIQKRKVIAQLYHSGMPASELALAIKVSSLLPFTEIAAKEFGSWAHFLDEAGLLKERKSGRGGYQSIATDGHLCLSLGERAICEHLTRNGIIHEKEPMYPHHEELNPNELLRGDFLVNGMIIEFAGMMSNPDYASRMETKQKLAKTLKLKWMKLEAASLNDLDKMLEKIRNKV